MLHKNKIQEHPLRNNMKKIFTLLSAILITLISFSARAQDKDTKEYVKSYLGLLGGISNPSGNFAQANYSNNSAGFAKKGFTTGLDGAFYIYKNLAIGATFTFQDQGELNSADVQNLSTGYNTDFNKDITTVNAVNRYNNFNLMAGPQYSFAISKFTIDMRVSAGLVKSTSTPSLAIVFDNSNNPGLTLEQHSSEAKAFAYGGSAGLRYNLGGSWDIGLKANYINSNGLTITNGNNPNTMGRFVTKQPITELQTTLGISLRL
jgi:hypothetical protein